MGNGFDIKIFSKIKENSTTERVDIISSLPIQKPSHSVAVLISIRLRSID